MAATVPLRRDVPIEHTWDASSVFASDTQWEEAIAKVHADLAGVSKFHGHITTSAAALLAWFTLQEDLIRQVMHIWIYASMFHEVDTADGSAAAKQARASGLYAKFAAATAFAEPELLAAPPETLESLRADPSLSVYGHYFDELLRRKEHVRSAEVEEVLGLAMEPFETASGIHGILSDADLKFEPKSGPLEQEITQGTIGTLLSSPDRETRRIAWETYSDAYLAHKHSMAACIAAGIQQNVLRARVHRYSSSLEAALAPGNIPTQVFHSLIDAFKRRLPLWHRYWDLRRRALKVDKLHVYDIKAPLSQANPSISFEQSMKWICEGMAPLGTAYVEAMRRGVAEQRWVDKFPNHGKRMGAFSSGSQGTHPFILMSYDDSIYDLSTLAHELGHSMHSYHTWQTQPPAYADYGMFVAEVASNFNQALVRDYLFKTQLDRDFQIALIEEAMANFHRYFFIMPTLARFELEIHERVERGEALTADTLIDLMAALFAEGYGDKVEFDKERIGITWAEFPTHLYSNFYVYQYATGIAGAHALAEGVAAGTPGAKDRYLDFLRAGSSRYELDVLKSAGVDLSTPVPVEKAFDSLAGMVDRLESLLF